MKLKISPSILNCDIANLSRELDLVGNADRIHVDIMDGHFVPNLSWGVPVAAAVAQATPVPVDAHLMIEDPDRWAMEYAGAGAELVNFHIEAAKAPIRLARQLRGAGVKAGMALRPATPVEPYLEWLEEFDLVLVMTVEPGFGGQSFLPQTLAKVRKLRAAINERGLTTEIQVDGGINRETIALAAEAGADNFVAGSAIYQAEDPHAEVAKLRELAERAQ